MIQYTASSPFKSTVSQQDEVIFSLKHFNPPEMERNSETTFLSETNIMQEWSGTVQEPLEKKSN